MCSWGHTINFSCKCCVLLFHYESTYHFQTKTGMLEAGRSCLCCHTAPVRTNQPVRERVHYPEHVKPVNAIHYVCTMRLTALRTIFQKLANRQPKLPRPGHLKMAASICGHFAHFLADGKQFVFCPLNYTFTFVSATTAHHINLLVRFPQLSHASSHQARSPRTLLTNETIDPLSYRHRKAN